MLMPNSLKRVLDLLPHRQMDVTGKTCVKGRHESGFQFLLINQLAQ